MINSTCSVIRIPDEKISWMYMGVESGGDGGDTSPAIKISGGDVPSKNTHENLK